MSRGGRRDALLVGVGVIALALAGCAAGEPDASEPQEAPTQEPAPNDVEEQAREPDDAAPEPEESAAPDPAAATLLDFTAPGVTGSQVVGVEHAGGAVALWFWAPW